MSETTTQQASRTQQRIEGFQAHAPLVVGSAEVPVAVRCDHEGAREVPTGALLRAIPAWLGLTWIGLYIVAPILLALGTSDGGNVLLTGIVTAPAFFATVLATTVLAAVAKPRIRLHRLGFEPVAWATAGWLGGWAIVHNTSMLLEPFSEMELGFLVPFLLLNVLEASLIGALLGTLTRSRVKALGMGAAFQGMQAALGLSILGAL